MMTAQYWSHQSGRKDTEMWNKQWERVDRFLKKWKLIERGDHILLGISGGADSVCLARYFLAKRESLALNLYAVHVNHMLRGDEAKRDEEFVREFCRQWNIPLHVEYRDIKKESREKKCSEEEAGRLARYECFTNYARQHQCSKIAVAHHQNDVAETILFRMIRGTGVQGMAGILPVNGEIIRPFLCLSREEIIDVLKELKQDYVDDSTNKCEEYSRNYIRHRILPEMEHINKKATVHVSELGMQMQELLAYITPKMDALYKEKLVHRENGELFLEEQVFYEMDLFEQKEILRRMLFETCGHQKDISLVHIEQLLTLMGNQEGKQQDCPYNVLARKTGEGLVLTKKSKSVKSAEQPLENSLENPLEDSLEVEFSILPWNGGKVAKRDCVKYFDYDKMKYKPCLRTRESGDYFIMDKEGHHKSLARYFIDAKVPSADRGKQVLLADGSHIMWILGGRISEFYKVSSDTKRVLKVSVQKDKKVKNFKMEDTKMADKINVLIPEETVDAKIKEIGEQISKDYAGKEVHLICILKGGVFFACELAKRITVPVSLDFMQVSSYGNATESSGIVRIKKDLDDTMENKEVIIVEDIIDSGRTLHYLIPVLKQRNPASIRLCALLNKPDRREVEVQIDYLGFDIPDEFVVGYGLDYAQKYRNLPFIGVVEPDAAEDAPEEAEGAENVTGEEKGENVE